MLINENVHAKHFSYMHIPTWRSAEFTYCRVICRKNCPVHFIYIYKKSFPVGGRTQRQNKPCRIKKNYCQVVAWRPNYNTNYIQQRLSGCVWYVLLWSAWASSTGFTTTLQRQATKSTLEMLKCTIDRCSGGSTLGRVVQTGLPDTLDVKERDNWNVMPRHQTPTGNGAPVGDWYTKSAQRNSRLKAHQWQPVNGLAWTSKLLLIGPVP